jgi:PAS domain S-box-containing protein
LGYWRQQATVGNIANPDDIPVSPDSTDFQLLAENLPTLCWIARGDGYIYWYNKRWHDYCGTTPDAMEGWGWQSVHDPDELPRVMESWTRSIATGEAFEMIFPIRGNDGVFRRFLTRVVAVRNAAGTVVRWIGTNTEVESHLRTEEALAASEAKFGVLTDAMPQMVWSNLPDGTVDYVNERWSEFSGPMDPGTVASDNWRNAIHPDDRERVLDLWRKRMADGAVYSDEYRMRDHSGEYRWILGRAVAARDGQGNITRWVGTCIDIDEAKRNADQTELLSRELSHRIKNIFAVIGGLIGLSTYRDPASKDFAKRLGGRISALGRAHDFARPHSDQSRPYADFNSLHGMLEELLVPYREDDRDCIVISGENVRIDERSATPIALVIHELATNAVKYGALSANDGRIEIETGVTDETVTIRWTEVGGPTVSPPVSVGGFGTQLSNISVEDQLGGKIERNWHPSGLQVMLVIDALRLRAND